LKSIISRYARVCAVAVIAATGVAVAGSPALAASKVVHLSCADSSYIKPDGTTGDVIIPGAPPFDLPTDIPTFTSQAVAPGSTFTAEAPSATINIPKHLDPLPGISVDVNEGKNVKTWIKVSGAASIGNPTVSGGNVTNAIAQKTGADEILLLFPGNKTGSTVPAGNLFFTGGGSFTSPKISLPVTANNAAGDITFSVEKFQTDSAVVINVPPAIGARAACTPTGDASLGSITVKDPRAPLAVDDSAKTDQNKAVNVDVLANDGKNSLGQDPDPASLTVTSNPGHGKAEVQDDGTVTYTPNTGFSGTDTFKYSVCDSVEVPQAARATSQFCDTATVTVTVASPVTPQGGGSGTTTTTVAKELPRTGRSSTPLALIGFGSLTLGAVAVRGARRRRATS
jgi:LPXTG-motif cell wall-anchored protein